MNTIRWLLLFLSAIFFSPHALALFTFPSTNATWVYQYFNEFQQPGPYTTYTINGDTVIGNRNYKRIYGCSWAWGTCNSGSVRDSNNVVYYIPDTSSIEYILYNFNLNIGDTFYLPYDHNITFYNYVIVWDVDTVMASDGPHRRLFVSSDDYWIEGVGSQAYLFLPTGYLGLSGNDKLECLSTDSGDWYGNSTCIASIHNPLDLKNSVSLYPNPFSVFTKLEFNYFIQNGELELFNSFGEMVRKEYISNTTYHVLNRNALTSGLYFLQLKSESGILQKKIIIE